MGYDKGGFFQKVGFVFQISQSPEKKYSKKTILNLKFKIPAQNSTIMLCMGGNLKFQVQDSFFEYIFFEIWRSKKRIALSEKKSPISKSKVESLNRKKTQNESRVLTCS